MSTPKIEKRKIIFYTAVLAATGGGQAAMTLLSRELVARGYEVHIFTRPPHRQDHPYVQALRAAGVAITVLPRFADIAAFRAAARVVATTLVVPYALRRKVPMSQAWIASKSIAASWLAGGERRWIRSRLAAACRRYRAEPIVHVWGPAALTPLILEWAWDAGVAALYHEMGEADASYVRTWDLEPTIAALCRARAVVCCSQSVVACVRSVYKYEGPVASIPFMVEDACELPPAASRPLTIGAIGRLVPHKRFPDLIQAIQRLQNDGVDARLIIAGGGPERESLERLCRSLGVERHVEFLGPFTHVSDVMARFDVFALTSSSESQCMPITESMAYSKPAVVSAIGGMPDFVDDGVTGYVVPLGDLDGLVAALRRFSDDPTLALRMGSAARLKFVARYRPEAVTNALTELYSDLVPERKTIRPRTAAPCESSS